LCESLAVKKDKGQIRLLYKPVLAFAPDYVGFLTQMSTNGMDTTSEAKSKNCREPVREKEYKYLVNTGFPPRST